MHEERMQVRVSDIFTRRGDTEHHRTIFSFSPANEVYTSTPKHVSWNKIVLKRHFYFLDRIFSEKRLFFIWQPLYLHKYA